MKVRTISAITAAVGLLGSASNAALAENSTNEAWIGQTGETNTISILQQGSANRAGADNTTHRINQEGRFNTLSIDQFGRSNSAGAGTLGEDLPEGLNQEGDHNQLSVRQHNMALDAFNFLGAVFQSSLSGGSALANLLTIVQEETGGDDTAGHRIGSVTQISTANGQGENSATLTQTGGNNNLGNTIERLIQSGYANVAIITQSVGRNSVAFARQQGDHNRVGIEQRDGSQNAIDSFDQTGTRNEAEIVQAGNRNHTARVLQSNQGVAIAGNRMILTIAGDDNGGDNFGGQGAFTSQTLIRSSAYQGAFFQIGDSNDISYTVNGGNENLAGIMQYGDGNGAIVTISHADGANSEDAARNEVGIVQQGDGNDMSLKIVGSDNVAGASVDGDRSVLNLSQTGNGNLFDIAVHGDDNNNSASVSVGNFRGRLAATASNAGLAPGSGLQSGSGNSVKVSLTGDSNLFAFRQEGIGNAAVLIMNGSANQAVVDQSNNANQAAIKQSGSGNSTSIVQF